MNGTIKCPSMFRKWTVMFVITLALAGNDAIAASMPENFVLYAQARELDAVAFKDGEGRSRNLADFAGRFVLLNIWATWCGPCREEMPTLDDLQARLGGKDFEVVALSIDRAGPALVRKFLAELNLTNLLLYIDETGAAARAVGAIGLPTTFLIDRRGRELGRLVGPAEWNAPEVVAYIKALIEGSKERN